MEMRCEREERQRGEATEISKGDNGRQWRRGAALNFDFIDFSDLTNLSSEKPIKT